MRNVLTVAALIISVTLAGAQGVSVGLKGGLNFPSVDAVGLGNVGTSNVENASGYHVGPFVKVKVSKLAVQAEVLYSFQETNMKIQPTVGNDFDLSQRLGYLTVPVMARLYTVAGINLQAGPQFGFLLNGTAETNLMGATTSTDIKNSLKGTDIGFNIGAGIDLPFGLDIHARYIIGISDINDISGADVSRNNQIQVSIGYSFLNLGR